MFRALVVLGLLASASAFAGPRALVVVAHPDDEYCMAATIVRIARELGGVVDQLVVTNGEGGFRYSTPGEAIYGKKLTDEAVGRRELPAIRKRELKSAGKILGVRSHEFLDEKDFGFTLDVNEGLLKWRRDRVSRAIGSKLRRGHYDLVLALLPTLKTHGHHQAATRLAIDAVSALPEAERPAVLGCWTEPAEKRFRDEEHSSEVDEARAAAGEGKIYAFDRRRTFGFKEKLSYHVWVNWMIAEHKSQGAFQLLPFRDDFEYYTVLGGNPAQAETVFAAINAK